MPTTSRTKKMPTLTARDARRLLLHRQRLLQDPATRATPSNVRTCIERMGFVQVDTITVVERAHDHILMSRFDEYRPPVLKKLIEKKRQLFEGFTHDASILPATWLEQWQVQYDRRRQRIALNTWWKGRLGDEPEKMIDYVRGRIDREGPLRSRDFEKEDPDAPSGWWKWKPQKVALEYLWHVGELKIVARENFQKIYDFTHKAFPHVEDFQTPTDEEHVDWACTVALDRLGCATPSELAGFLKAVSLADVRRWCAHALKDDRVIEVLVESADGSAPKKAIAPPNIKRTVRALPDAPEGMRLLSPFDPVLRDRARALRLFNFDYRFEAFVPGPKRRFGYYVLPVLDGEELVARVDPKFHRDRGELLVNRAFWEPHVKVTAKKKRELEKAVARLATQIGAERWAITEHCSRADVS